MAALRPKRHLPAPQAAPTLPRHLLRLIRKALTPLSPDLSKTDGSANVALILIQTRKQNVYYALQQENFYMTTQTTITKIRCLTINVQAARPAQPVQVVIAAAAMAVRPAQAAARAPAVRAKDLWCWAAAAVVEMMSGCAKFVHTKTSQTQAYAQYALTTRTTFKTTISITTIQTMATLSQATTTQAIIRIIITNRMAQLPMQWLRRAEPAQAM